MRLLGIQLSKEIMVLLVLLLIVTVIRVEGSRLENITFGFDRDLFIKSYNIHGKTIKNDDCFIIENGTMVRDGRFISNYSNRFVFQYQNGNNPPTYCVVQVPREAQGKNHSFYSMGFCTCKENCTFYNTKPNIIDYLTLTYGWRTFDYECYPVNFGVIDVNRGWI